MQNNTLKSLFDLSIEMGIKNDVRGEKAIKKYLEENKSAYEKLDENKKQYFDKDFLTNPYHDSKIYFGDENKIIKKIIVGVDVEGPEILLVNEYNKLNPSSPIDAVFGHHPEAKALVDLPLILKTVLNSVDFSHGVAVNQVEKINEPRIGELNRNLSPLNYNRTISFAKMLDIPFFGIHTPADNMCYKYFEKMIENNADKITKLKDIIFLLEEIPEMQMSKKNGVGPQIWAGTEESLAGKIAITGITGGTSGSDKIYKQYADAGVGTILVMHISKDHLEKAKENNLNVIMTDHMASDSLGLNLILDEFEKLGVEILDFSGFMRVSRV